MMNGLEGKNVSNICGDSKGNLVCSIDELGVFRWSSNDNKWIYIKDSESVFNKDAFSSLKYFKNSFYFSTNDNIYMINTSDWIVKQITKNLVIQGVSDIEVYDDIIYFSMA